MFSREKKEHQPWLYLIYVDIKLLMFAMILTAWNAWRLDSCENHTGNPGYKFSVSYANKNNFHHPQRWEFHGIPILDYSIITEIHWITSKPVSISQHCKHPQGSTRGFEIFEGRVKPLGGSMGPMGEHREHPKLILFEVVHPDSYCILRRQMRREDAFPAANGASSCYKDWGPKNRTPHLVWRTIDLDDLVGQKETQYNTILKHQTDVIILTYCKHTQHMAKIDQLFRIIVSSRGKGIFTHFCLKSFKHPFTYLVLTICQYIYIYTYIYTYIYIYIYIYIHIYIYILDPGEAFMIFLQSIQSSPLGVRAETHKGPHQRARIHRHGAISCGEKWAASDGQ